MTLDEEIDVVCDELQYIYHKLKDDNNKGRISQAISYLEDIDTQAEGEE